MYCKGQVVTIKETHKRGIICDKLKTSDRTLYQIKSEDNIIYALEDELCQITLTCD